MCNPRIESIQICELYHEGRRDGLWLVTLNSFTSARSVKLDYWLQT